MREIKKMMYSTVLLAITVVVAGAYKVFPGLSALSSAQGGNSFGIEIIFLALISFLFGFKYGVISAVLYGYINFLIDGYSLHWGSLFLDYLLAYIGFSLGFIFKPSKSKSLRNIIFFCLILLIGSTIRLASTTTSGVLFFAEYAPDGVHPFIYSLTYNFSYISSSLGFSLLFGTLIINSVIDIVIRLNPGSQDIHP